MSFAEKYPAYDAYLLNSAGETLRSIVKEQHIRFSLQQDGITMDGIGFGLAGKFPLLQGGATLDIVFSLEENEWNNQKNLQLRIIDLAPSKEGNH